MSSNSNAHSNNDPWALAYSSNTAYPGRRTRTTKSAEHVPDSWDEDDGNADEDEDEDVDNAALWRDANSKQPMPEVILTTTSTSSVPAPPPVALQQPMRILKRPSASTSTSSTSVTSTASSGSTTLKDREVAYQAARARIFGRDEGRKSDVQDGAAASLKTLEATCSVHETEERPKAITSGSTSKAVGASSSLLAASVSISRNPRGPPSSSSSTSGSNASSSQDKSNPSQKGFMRRRGGGGGGKVHGRNV